MLSNLRYLHANVTDHIHAGSSESAAFKQGLVEEALVQGRARGAGDKLLVFEQQEAVKMHLACIVCYEILKSIDNIHAAPCGHLLHFQCWERWLKRSLNCPECRKPTHQGQLIKLFFNTGDGDDYHTLRNRYDSLRCEFQCKISEVQNANALLKKKVDEIRDLKINRENEQNRFKAEIEELKAQNRKIQDSIHQNEIRLKDKIKFLKRQCESTYMQIHRTRESKDKKEKILKDEIKALKRTKRSIIKSKDKEIKRLRETQKANVRFLQKFSEGSVKLVEMLRHQNNVTCPE